MLHITETTLKCKGLLNGKAVSTLIQEVDTKESETNYLISKIPKYYYWIYCDVRNTFYEGVGIETLKCVVGFNHCGCRDEKTNNNLIDNYCP